MIDLRPGTRIWVAAGVTDMRRGFQGLAAQVQTALGEQPYSGHVFIFRGRRGDTVKLLWFDGDGLCLFQKRLLPQRRRPVFGDLGLERGRFVWPQAMSGTVSLSRAQLSMLLEGIDWRAPIRTAERVLSVFECFSSVYAAFLLCARLFLWHTSPMSGAALADLDSLDLEAVKELARSGAAAALVARDRD